MLEHAIEAFLRHGAVARIIVVIHRDDAALFDRLIAPRAKVERVIGGESRSQSVLAGLNAATGAARVLIHDGAHPLVSQALIGRVHAALDCAPGAAPALAVTDALWRGSDGRVRATVARDGLFRAQTPQGFHRTAILAAHADHPGDATDDVEVALAAGLDVAIVEGDEANLKITHAPDFGRAERLRANAMEIRTGNGFDVHAFCEGDQVTLCGVTIAHDKALAGHSDADVGLHALTDAIYGALAEGDIGRHFPPSDPQWRGAASDIFLRHAMARVAARGLALANADVTLICETPKITPHSDAMRARLAAITGAAIDRISVKATTSERLGFTGRGEGIASLATVTLVQP